MNNERTEYIFLWFIENYSYCWHKNGEKLISPEFTTDSLEGNVWTLHLYPRGYESKDKGTIGLFLYRSKNGDGPEEFPLKYELSVLAADGSTLFSGEYEVTCKMGIGYGMCDFPQMEEILLRRKYDYLPQDTLSVRCKMWKDGGSVHEARRYSARTRIGIEKISFLHKVEHFSDLKPNEKKILQVRSHSKTGYVVSSTLYFTDGEGEVRVEIAPSNGNYILSTQKLSLLDGLGNAIECGEVDNRFDATRENIRNVSLSLTRHIILKRKSEYLPNDELSLICECTFSTGVEFEKIEETQHGLTRAVLKQNKERNNKVYDTAQKLSTCPNALDDLKAIYSNQRLTDVELKTKTKSFPAHRLVLCARSSVFYAMLTNDMKEKNTDCINVDDLENDTVQQLLLFLYSDSLENLHWESAIKLYYVGDKYAIEKLKLLCASFLVDNLTTSSASELLLLADTHNDSDLKKLVEDFILEYEEEVFGSDEWEKLIETSPQLVIKTMHLKYKRKKGGKR